ncbi:phage portal protein [Parvularcula maris]|uniref:Phage portal protein n=1 Tax=Parvularcula maris TaxID=2965077 RepID=A0A9X2RJ29_9PROT|nr:phage portal protein [Parvularcula maris]MCQ8184233.1 phage portal protein [Parvularcula maris]
MLKRMTAKRSVPEAKSTSLAALIAAHGAGEPGVSAKPPGYTTNVVAYRCIRMIAEAASSVPLRTMSAGGPVSDGALARLLAQPSPDQSGRELLEEVYAYLQTHGNAYVERLDYGDDPRALFLLHPGSIEQAEGGYRHRMKRGERLFRPDAAGRMALLHLSLWQPGEGKSGHAPLATASDAIRLHNAACAWNKQLLDNAARPSGALVHRGPEGAQHLTPEQFDRLRSELDDSFTGLRGAGRPLLLDGGLDWKPMGLTPAEMDFQNLKDSAARDIALAFGVPPMLLGIKGDNTYANYREANLAFWRQTVLPLVAKVAGALSGWLDPGRSTWAEPDTGAVEALAPERSARLDRIASAEFLTDAEKRIALGFSAQPEAY